MDGEGEEEPSSRKPESDGVRFAAGERLVLLCVGARGQQEEGCPSPWGLQGTPKAQRVLASLGGASE